MAGSGSTERRQVPVGVPRRRLAAVPLLLAVAATAACGGGDGDGAEPLADQVADARERTPVAVPAEAPPGPVEAWLTLAEGSPVLSLASRDAPTVTVCTGALADCREVAAGTEIRVGTADGRDVLVTVAAREEPDAAADLPADLAAYWADVPLTTGVPGWLAPA